MMKKFLASYMVKIMLVTLVLQAAPAVAECGPVAEVKPEGYTLDGAFDHFSSNRKVGAQVATVVASVAPVDIASVGPEDFVVVPARELSGSNRYNNTALCNGDLRWEMNPPYREFDPSEMILVHKATGIPVMKMRCLNPIETTARWRPTQVAPPAMAQATPAPATPTTTVVTSPAGAPASAVASVTFTAPESNFREDNEPGACPPPYDRSVEDCDRYLDRLDRRRTQDNLHDERLAQIDVDGRVRIAKFERPKRDLTLLNGSLNSGDHVYSDGRTLIADNGDRIYAPTTSNYSWSYSFSENRFIRSDGCRCDRGYTGPCNDDGGRNRPPSGDDGGRNRPPGGWRNRPPSGDNVQNVQSGYPTPVRNTWGAGSN